MLGGLGAAIVPRHLVAGDVAHGRLVAPHGFLDSHYRYAVKIDGPKRPKTECFVAWLKEAAAEAA